MWGHKETEKGSTPYVNHPNRDVTKHTYAFPLPCPKTLQPNGTLRNGVFLDGACTQTELQTRALRIPFRSEAHAQIAQQVISVDKELQQQAVKRTLEVQGNILVVYVRKQLRSPI